MPRGPMSDEQRAAASARMKAMHAAKKSQKDDLNINSAEKVPVSHNNISQDDEMSQLRRQIAELKAMVEAKPPQLEAPQAPGNPGNPAQALQGQVANGRVVGLTHRFSIDPRDYDDPTKRLAKEPKLQRFAFDLNYALTWAISTTQYTTMDNIHTIEPKFDIELHRVVLDDDGEPTNQRYKISGLTFHEDPTAAITVARENGIDVESMGEAQFLNEMRYLRARDWLLELFYPPKKNPNKRRKEAVIDNRLVYVFEAATPEGQSTKIDYEGLRDGVVRTG